MRVVNGCRLLILLVSLWVGVLGCGDTPVNVVSLLVSFVGRGARLWRHPG